MEPKTLEEWRKEGKEPEDGTPILCGYKHCKTTFPYKHSVPGKKYCSTSCKERACRRYQKLPTEPRPCVVCGKIFTPEHPRYVACPGSCRRIRATSMYRGSHDPGDPSEELRRREQLELERKIRQEAGRTQILCELMRQYMDRFPASAIKSHTVRTRSKRSGESMVVMRSDLHPGLITPSYNSYVFHRRMELLTELVVRIKDIISETIPIQELVIFDLGDMISGQGIFDGQAWQSDRHVLEQIYVEAAPAIVAQNLTWLEHFPRVREYSVPGNHGRTGQEHPEAVNWDNVLAQEVAARMEKVKNYEINIEWGWWQVAEVQGWRFLLVHGHQIRSWLNIPFYGLTQKGMRWQGSLPERWDYLCHGHFHVPFMFPWNNFVIVGNGSLVSDDEFALRQLGMSSRPAQQVFGVHPEHGITWHYTLHLGENDDPRLAAGAPRGGRGD